MRIAQNRGFNCIMVVNRHCILFGNHFIQCQDIEEATGGKTMLTSYKEFWTKILTWNATATRAQYWIPVIINYFLGGLLVNVIEKLQGHELGDIYNIADLTTNTTAQVIYLLVWVATLTLKVRRLHDTNHSAGWILIQFVPIIGTIWFFVLMVLPTTPESRWVINQSRV